MSQVPPPQNPPPPPPPTGSAAPRGGSATTVRAVLAVAVLALTVVALAVEENGQRGYEDWTAWAVFATVVAAVHLFPLFSPLDQSRTWDVVAGATAGLVLYWVAIVVPGISSNTAFVQTMAVAIAVAHCWTLPGRR